MAAWAHWVGGERQIDQSPLAARVPVKRVSWLCVMVTSVSVKVTWQPWLHSWPTESRAWSVRAGNRCALRAACGRPGKSMTHVWDDFIVLPSGRWTRTGVMAGWILVQGVLAIM